MSSLLYNDEESSVPPKRIVIVDNFDHPEQAKKTVTIQNNQVGFSGDQLVITGWKLLEFDEEHPPTQEEEEGITEFLPKGTRYYLPSKKIKTWKEAEQAKNGKSRRRLFKSIDKGLTNVFVSHNSIWTVNPEEPILEETVVEYDCRRRLFFVIFGATVVVAVLLMTVLYTGILTQAKGNVSKSTRRKFEPKHFEQVKEDYNAHALIMTTTVLFNLGASIILYRLFPQISKFRLKCVHAFMGLIAAVGSVVGVYFTLRTHDVEKKEAVWFLDIHGTLGFVMLGMIQIQFWFGFFSFLLPLASFSSQVKFVPIHKFFGGITFLVGITALVTGFGVFTTRLIPLQEYSSRSSRSLFINFSGVLTVILGIFIAVLITDFRFRRRRRPLVRLVPEEDITMLAKASAEEQSENGSNPVIS
jgi:cytochrome b-561